MKNLFLSLLILTASGSLHGQIREMMESYEREWGAQWGFKEIYSLLEAGVDAPLPKTTLVFDGGSFPRTLPRGMTPLMIASYCGYVNVAEALIKEGADVNASLELTPGDTLLLLRQQMHRLYPTPGESLLEAADPFAQGLYPTPFRYTPLMYAASGPHVRMLRLLLQKGALPDNSKGKAYGDSPLLSAVLTDYEEAVRLLLDAGADPGIANAEGVTPLMAACSHGNFVIAEMLLKGGADVLAQNSLGRDALWYAVHGEGRDENSGLFKMIDRAKKRAQKKR